MIRHPVSSRFLRRWFRPVLTRLESRDAPALFGPVDRTVNIGNELDRVAVGDFNGDGKLDLAVANRGGNDVSVLLGSGSGGFTVRSFAFAAGTFPEAVAVGDFNGDGKLDLAVANWGTADVAVLLGDGIGGFSLGPGSPIAAGNQAQSI